MDNTYRTVKVEEYVKELIARGIQPVKAIKNKKIHVREGIVGETVITWSEDEFGNPIVEREDKVTRDEKTGKVDHVVTKLDEFGNPVIDRNGHTNTWIMSDATLQKKYEQDSEMGQSIFRPRGTVQTFIQIQDDIEIEQWGKLEKIAKGGYINITDINDMYGISARDFNDTYGIIPDEDTKKLVNKK